VIWHSLESDGTINHYDIKFGKKILKNVPSALVEAVHGRQHEHEVR